MAEATKTANDIVLVAPIYWYALPAPAKCLMDHWSGWLDAPDYGFGEWITGKRMWLITSRADPAPDVPELAASMLRRSVEWLGMEWAGALHCCEGSDGHLSPEALAASVIQFRAMIAARG